MSLPPCIRHGVRGLADQRVIDALRKASGDDGTLLEKVESLTDFDGQLWVTWRRSADRGSLAMKLDAAWAECGGDRGTLHLTRSDEDYDYQEDCMNEAASPSGHAGEG